MAIKIQFIHEGKSVEYVLNQDISLQINAPAPSSPSNTISLTNATLTVTGAVPWGAAPVIAAQAAAPEAASPTAMPASNLGIEMVVNIPQLKVRESKTTVGEPLALLTLGTKLVVSSTSEKIGKITWRQVVSPETYKGKWVAELFEGDANPYLIAGSTPSFSAQSASTPAAAPTVVGDLAPLTGRFTLVKRKGPFSTYTALAIDGDSSRKLGVNVRELAYFGTPQWQWTREAWVGSYANSTKDMGMKWVRFFVAHTDYDIETIVSRTRKVLDALAQKGLLAVVTFADSLSEKGMFPKGDGQYHTGSRGHVIKDYFNNGTYRQNYLPFVQRIVNEFKGHAGVGMWQLMNELAIYNPPANDNDVKGFATFVDETSEMIYKLDSVHPISIGIINTAHIMPPGKNIRQFAREFYSQRKYIHVVTCHCYQFDHDTNINSMWEHEENCAIDAEIANETGRAMMWTEFGAAKDGERRASTERFLNKHFVQGNASAALQWGFMLELDGIPDSGIGDGRYGFSKTLNKQFDELTNLFKALPAKS